MFKLNRLELSGFKSFVDPVALEVSGGLTAIVGPNGCGKSNIADAVVWVLGERSAKSLRGETMQDVIFAGAKSRKPLGMAEVSLELLTDNGIGVAEDGRVTIGRRLFRSGESQYFLNGKAVRLKDIRDLLMDTGLGIRDYSMIEQGKIGMILSGKPQERRKLLEEAAGITRYRDRRRLAEIKLEEARANLERLHDIVAEVERSLRSLKRQANAARRFQTRESEYKELLRQVLAGRWSALQSRLATFRAQIDDLLQRDAGLTADLHRQEAGHAEAREIQEAIAQSLAERHRRVAEMAATIEGKQEFLKGSRHRLEELAERITAGQATAENRRGRQAVLRQTLSELEDKRAELDSERQQAESEVSAEEARIARIEAFFNEAVKRLEGQRSRLLTSINELSGLKNRLHQDHLEREKGNLKRRHVEEELEQKAVELQEAERHLDACRAKTEELQQQADETETLLTSRTERLDRLVARQSELARRQDELEQELTDLCQTQRLLTQLGEQQEEHREAVQRSLADAGLEDAAFLGDELQVAEGWAASLDLYLGELENAVVLPQGADTLHLARSLQQGRAEGSLLLPTRPGQPPTRVEDLAIQSTLGAALSLPEEIAGALPEAYLVDLAADAVRLAGEHPGVAFISRDRLWAQAGILHVLGAEALPGQLERQRELAAIEPRIPQVEKQLAAVTQEIEALAGQHRQFEGEILDTKSQLVDSRQALAVATARLEDATSRKHRLEVEHRTLASEQEELGREIAKMAKNVRFLEERLRRAESTHGELESAFDAAQRQVDEAREEREAKRTSGVSRRGRLELVAERFEANEQELARFRAELEEHGSELDLWQQEAARLSSRQTEIHAARQQAERDLQVALEGREAAQKEVLTEQERLEEQRSKVSAFEERMDALRADRDRLREETSEVRVAEAGLRQESEHLAASFRQEFEQDPPIESGEAPSNLQELEADLDRCKQALERVGPVNLLAAAEYEEQKERHEFLTVQRADVQASAERLRQTIREINETSSQRFRETFEEVNQNFRKTFVDLFRGGEAEMRLLDEEDVLESVIEITARPPGKRMQNIMLMSGGEKALTAIGLLFALFKSKPSPFCILDEVDAPLDDLNTLRFVELLRKMSGETQFVIITHNKLTMEAANLLYGVTMQERGVSNLVAVELDAVQPEVQTGEFVAVG